MPKQAICVVCLRTDIKLRKVETKFISFHDELCDFMLNMEATYCWYCEHQLKKAYRFRKICRSALKVLRTQKKMKAPDRTPLNKLCELLPPIPVGQWIEKNNAVIIYEEVEDPKPVNKVIITLDGKIINTTADQENVMNEINTNETNHSDDVSDQTIIKTEVTEFDNSPVQHSAALNNDVNVTKLQIADVYSLCNTNERKHDGEHNGDAADPIRVDCVIKLEDENIEEMSDEDTEIKEKTSKNAEFNFDYDMDSSNEFSDSKVNEDNESNVSADSSDQSISLVNYNDILKAPIVEKPTFIKKVVKKRKSINIREKLKSALEQRLASWGEIKSRDGKVIDKAQMLDVVENKLKSHQVKVLWCKVKASNLHKPTEKVLNFIQTLHKQFYNKDYESVFDIEYLNTEEKRREEFAKRKTYSYYQRAEYKCELCFTKVATGKLLNLHMQKYHSESSGSLTCTICPQRFKSKELLQNHMYFWHDVVYKCKLCDAVLYMKKSWMTHYDHHKGIVHKCIKCNKTYRYVESYWYHMSARHAADSARVQTCRHCACVFVAPSALTKHMKRHHKTQVGVEIVGSDDAKCKECDIMFVSNEVYNKHVAISHLKVPIENYRTDRRRVRRVGLSYGRRPTKRKEVPCRLCNKVAHHPSWLKNHFMLEHPEANVDVEYADRPYLCDVCGKGYSTIFALNTHRDTVHLTEPRYECEICSQKFVSKIRYYRHKITLHKDNATESHSCSVCGKTFVNNSNLQRHRLIHKGDRKFKCIMCPKDFIYQ